MSSKEQNTCLYLLILLLISVVVTSASLGFSKAFVGGDYGVSFHYPDRLSKLSYYIWDRFQAPGRQTVTNTLGFLWTNLVSLLFHFGLGSVFIERITFFSFFAVTGTGMFFLLNLILENFYEEFSERSVAFGSFVGALLYMFNHFTVYIVGFFPPIGPYHLSYMLLPWVLLFFIYNLQVRTSFSTIILFSLALCILLGGNPSNTFSILVLLAFYYLFVVRTSNRSKSVKVKLFFFVSSVLFVLLSSYVFLPVFGLGSNPYTGTINSDAFVDSLEFNSSQSSLLSLFRLWGSPSKGQFLYWFSYEENWFFIFLGYLIPVLAVIPLLFGKRDRLKDFFSIVALVALFFAKGSNIPFRKVFLAVYENIPYFEVYRAVYHKFVFFVCFSYSYLIGYLCSKTSALLQSRKKISGLLAFSFAFLILLYNWPFFTNKFTKEGYLTKIPEVSYEEGANLIKEAPAISRVLTLPSAIRGRAFILQWEHNNKYNGMNPERFLLDTSVLNAYWFTKNNMYDLTDKDSWVGTKLEINLNSVLNFADILNIRYIFVHRDFASEYVTSVKDNKANTLEGLLKSHEAEFALNKISEVSLLGNSNYYSIYEVSNDLFLPLFYVPLESFCLRSDISVLPAVFDIVDSVSRSIFYLCGDSVSDFDRNFTRLAFYNVLAVAEYLEATSDVAFSELGDELMWPEVNVKPSSWKYSLVWLKERWTEWRAGGSLAKADVLIWHASKRIAENAKWPDAENAEDRLENYLEKARRAVSVLKNVPEEERDDDYWGMVNKVLAYINRGSDELQSLENISDEPVAQVEEFKASFSEWVDAQGEFWCPEGSYCYEVDLPEGGGYEIFVSDSAAVDLLANGKVVEVNRESVSIDANTSQNQDSWVSYGRYSFEEGAKQRLVLDIPEPLNLISDQAWQEWKSVSVSDSGLLLNALNFKGLEKNQPSVYQKIEEWVPGEKYSFSFDYKLERGVLGVAVVEDVFDWEKLEEWDAEYEEVKDNPDFFKTEVIFKEELRSSFSNYEKYSQAVGWDSFKAEIEADYSTRGAKFFVYTVPDKGSVGNVQIRNSSLRRIVEPQLILKKEQLTDNELAGKQIPDIKFIKVNPTKYKIQVTGATEPYPLIFSESYHNGWKLYKISNKDRVVKNSVQWLWWSLGRRLSWVAELFLDNKDYGEEVATYFDGDIKEGTHRSTFLEPATFETWGREPLDVEHVEVNGFANSWFVEPEDVGGEKDYELIVEFWPQRLFYLGLLISGTTLLTCLGYMGYAGTAKLLRIYQAVKNKDEN